MRWFSVVRRYSAHSKVISWRFQVSGVSILFRNSALNDSYKQSISYKQRKYKTLKPLRYWHLTPIPLPQKFMVLRTHSFLYLYFCISSSSSKLLDQDRLQTNFRFLNYFSMYSIFTWLIALNMLPFILSLLRYKSFNRDFISWRFEFVADGQGLINSGNFWSLANDFISNSSAKASGRTTMNLPSKNGW